MSITADRLRQLRRDAGFTRLSPPAPMHVPSSTERTPTIAELRRLLGRRDRAMLAAPMPLQRSVDRSLPGTELAPGLRLVEATLPMPFADSVALHFARRDESIDPARCLFFDTETTGLAGGTGTRAFMIGAANLDQIFLKIRQLLITTMAAESDMLECFAQWLAPETVLMSYNGRIYDASLLKTRYRLARQKDPLSHLDHVDLLYPTRRAYRGVFENCRLATIERQVLQVLREDDLPGSQAPAAWLHYLRGGSSALLRRVAAHNHQDVVTLALLLEHLVARQVSCDLSAMTMR